MARVDYFDDPDAPSINSVVPSVTVAPSIIETLDRERHRAELLAGRLDPELDGTHSSWPPPVSLTEQRQAGT